jgi:hypothetical protein
MQDADDIERGGGLGVSLLGCNSSRSSDCILVRRDKESNENE